jgi:DMSO/TMAO reductase YedYZ molybdopterin-dependent catalytic subunit
MGTRGGFFAAVARPASSPLAAQLPPGQRLVDGFPRFGTHLHRPAPPVPADPVIDVGGALVEPFSLRVAELGTLPRRVVTADFHCVAGWSAAGLRWEGVSFETLYRTIIEPRLKPGPSVTHLVFAGLDGYRSIVEIGDALAEAVIVADQLNGRPLDPDHGAPCRLVSPGQYGFVSTKHLCRIEVHPGRPAYRNPARIRIGRHSFSNPLIQPHPRARVWREERHRYLPAWSVRWFYRLFITPIATLSARGSRTSETSDCTTD